uniref:Uncharacterized protein n=1 Tax=Cannabis sativa TaxID=3483 RepID=A0A803NHG5_CANSA
MVAYLRKIRDLLSQLKGYTISTIALARLASSTIADKANLVPIQFLEEPNIIVPEEIDMLDDTTAWMTPIATYLQTVALPEDKNEANKLRRKAVRYLILDRIMYNWSFSMPLLRCITKVEAEQLMIRLLRKPCRGQRLSKKIL